MLSNDFVHQVIEELKLNETDLSLFTPPKKTYSKYVRNIIYEMTKQQFGIMQNVIEFPEDVTKVKDMQRCLITYLDSHPKYQDSDYRYIWLRFAHQYYLNNGTRIKIENNNFQSSHAGQIPMSFVNNFSNNDTIKYSTHTPIVEEIEDSNDLEIDYEQNALTYNDENNIQYLIVKMNQLHI